MKTKLTTVIIVFGLIFVSCKKNKEVEKNGITKKEFPILKSFMLGNWETTYIKIDYKTYQKSDSSFVFEDDFSKPNTGKAQSKYNNDGTFSAWFKQPDGSKIGETNGHWKTKADSLYIDYIYNDKKTQVWYSIKKVAGGFEGKVIYDWDGDAEFDDTLFMKSKKLK